jgi:hypothetical protein
MLNASELLTGTPTVTNITVGSSTDLTVASVARNTATITVEDDASVLASQAVQFSVTGGTTGTTYTLEVSCATDASPAQTLKWRQLVEVI